MTGPVRILVIHGPNLNLLGEREPEVYGSLTLAEIDRRLAARASELGAEAETMQSNLEGDLVEAVQAARGRADGIVLNPGGYSHTSVAIRDAVAAVSIPTVVAHLSNPSAREEFRRVDLVAGACLGSVSGFGWRSYVLALEGLLAHLQAEPEGG